MRLRVEDHGACYRFTITVLMDDNTSRRRACTCLYDPDSGRMAPVGISRRTVITRATDGAIVEIEEDPVAGDAEFTLDDENRLVWRDLTGGRTTAFERLMD